MNLARSVWTNNLQQTPTLSVTLQGLGWCLIVTLWFILVALGFASTPVVIKLAGVHTFYLSMSALLAMAQSIRFARSLDAAATVLRARQTPTPLWRKWLLHGIKDSSVAWAALAFGTISLAFFGAPWDAREAATAMVVSACFALVITLAVVGLVRRAWLWIALGTIALGLAVATIDVQTDRTLPWLLAILWVASTVVCAAAPLLLGNLLRNWSPNSPQALPLPWSGSLRTLMRRINAWFARYALLDGNVGLPSNTNGYSAFQVLLRFGGILPFASEWDQPLGSPLSALQVWMTGLWVFILSMNLACKDLHWRTLLAPGGLHRGRLGWHIATSTATLYAIPIAIWFGIRLSLTWLVSDHSLQHALDYLAHHAALPFQLAFGIAVGTLIRGTRAPGWWYGGLGAMWIVAGVFGFIATLTQAWQFDSHAVVTVSWPHLLGYLLCATVALWGANRLWTVERLLQYAPRGK